MGILDRVKEIEAEIARTQKNKATNYHIGLLKAKLSKLRSELLSDSKKSSAGGGDGFEVVKTGDARVALVGFPSVGKSTLLSTLTDTKSQAASYEFTTLTCIPGIIEYNDAKIQLLDLPGIIEGAAKGRGRGKQVIAVARTSDLVLMMLDASKAELQKELLTSELESVGIRLNQQPPDVVIRKKKAGGVAVTFTQENSHGIDLHLVRTILHEYKLHNADVLFREDVTLDQFLDVVEGNRKYIRCIYVANKVDTISLDEVDRLAHLQHYCVISCEYTLNLDYLLEMLWEYLNFNRIYTKKRGNKPDLSEPVICKRPTTVEDFCLRVHRDMVKTFRYALVWGRSAMHVPQRTGLDHVLDDEDVCQIVTKAG